MKKQLLPLFLLTFAFLFVFLLSDCKKKTPSNGDNTEDDFPITECDTSPQNCTTTFNKISYVSPDGTETDFKDIIAFGNTTQLKSQDRGQHGLDNGGDPAQTYVYSWSQVSTKKVNGVEGPPLIEVPDDTILLTLKTSEDFVIHMLSNGDGVFSSIITINGSDLKSGQSYKNTDNTVDHTHLSSLQHIADENSLKAILFIYEGKPYTYKAYDETPTSNRFHWNSIDTDTGYFEYLRITNNDTLDGMSYLTTDKHDTFSEVGLPDTIGQKGYFKIFLTQHNDTKNEDYESVRCFDGGSAPSGCTLISSVDDLKAITGLDTKEREDFI